VLVAGATGFVGGHLVPHLLKEGHQVVACGHDPARLERFSGAERLVLDLRRPDLAAHLPTDLDAVIHLAQANVPFPEGANDLFEVNAGSVQRLLEHSRRSGVRRFVYASTASVYGGTDLSRGGRPWREDDPLAGPGYYAATRQASDGLVRAYGEVLPNVVLRLLTPYGPGQANRLVPGLIARVRSGRPVTLREGGRPRMNPVFVDHVVDVFAQALTVAPNQVVNVAGAEVLSIREMAETIGRVVGRDPVFEEAPGGSGGDVVADTTRMRQVFRLPQRLTPFAEGVRAMLV
jgi:nucleoside-diphosphate-sugar epimerase